MHQYKEVLTHLGAFEKSKTSRYIQPLLVIICGIDNIIDIEPYCVFFRTDTEKPHIKRTAPAYVVRFTAMI